MSENKWGAESISPGEISVDNYDREEARIAKLERLAYAVRQYHKIEKWIPKKELARRGLGWGWHNIIAQHLEDLDKLEKS